VQFALNPDSFEYAVIEVNPRVSRSSALASKATGYPIAKVTSKIALGYRLDEIPNAVTKTTMACFEPAVDYCVLKIPKWPFDKFVTASRTLGTQMKATGEVMAIASSFEGAMMKAIRSLELNVYSLRLNKLSALSDGEIEARLSLVDDERIFVVTEALRRGMTPEEINAVTKIDIWFLDRFRAIVEIEQTLAEGKLDVQLLRKAKEMGFGDAYIGELCHMDRKEIKRIRADWGILPTYKMVDTCAGECDAATPYYYSGYDLENESNAPDTGKKRVLVLGSGPIRIGQGIEFDYCSVHSVWALKRLGCKTIIINNNPETVSTDFDVADRLYFEPLTPEDVENIVEVEKPWGAVVQFGGQTAIKLTKALSEMGVPILGTSPDGMDAAEDRERFDEILHRLEIPRAEGRTVFTSEEAVIAANEIGYPVLVRPSYVLGGQGMEIAYSERNVMEYMKIINRVQQEHPILVDKYLMGREVEVDGVFDGKDILIPGIMEHVERAGVHSGDSISVYPPLHVEEKHKETILRHTKELAQALGVIGLVNIQFVIYNDIVYVIEVNPRSSRTIPYISKVTGVPIIDLATKVMMGEKLADLGYGTGLYPEIPFYAVKMPVFSFEKLTNVDIGLGPEMKSTGEVLGLAETFPQALLKAFKGAQMRVPSKKGGRVILTVKDEDKGEVVGIARRLAELGVSLFATSGTCKVLEEAGVPVQKVNRVSEPSPNILDLIASGTVDLVVNTPTRGRKQDTDGFKIRRYAVEHSVSCVTSIDTVSAIVTVRSQGRSDQLQAVDITKLSSFGQA
jgi:carbamoyl-phosphate synthase large subunit